MLGDNHLRGPMLCSPGIRSIPDMHRRPGNRCDRNRPVRRRVRSRPAGPGAPPSRGFRSRGPTNRSSPGRPQFEPVVRPAFDYDYLSPMISGKRSFFDSSLQSSATFHAAATATPIVGPVRILAILSNRTSMTRFRFTLISASIRSEAFASSP